MEDRKAMMTKRLLREMVRELLSESKDIDKVIDAYYDLVAADYPDGFVPVHEVEARTNPKVEILGTQGKPRYEWKRRLERRFDFVYNSSTKNYDMTGKLTPQDRLKRFIRTFLHKNPDFVKMSPGNADVRFGLSTGDDLTQEQINMAFENSGITVSDVILPGAPGSSSGKYATYVIIDDDGTTSFDVVFSTKVVYPPTFDSQGIPTYYGGAEAMQINAMNDALRRKHAGPDGVDIQLGSRILKNVGAIVQMGGSTKADAFFAPMKGGKVDIDSPMAYVSLKNAGSPSQMNQWSGISKFKNRPEVASFINGLRAYLASIGSAEVMPDGLSCRSESSLSELGSGGLELAIKACWGLSYTPGKSGPESIDMIYICPAASISLQKVKSGTYEFTGGISLYGGELPPNDWEPYFYARRGDRNDGGIKKCRIFICPRDYRPSPEIIKNIENKSTVEVESLKLYIKDLIQEELATQNADHRMIENEIEDWLALNIFDNSRPTVTITLVDRRANFRGTGGFRSQSIPSKEIKIEHPSLDDGYIQFSLSEFQEVFGVPAHLRNYLQHSF